jgi:predicted dehydrogenase
VVNTLSHPLDYVRWLFGEGITLSAVTGQISDLELDVEDLAEIILKFKDGCVGSIHLDYFQRPPAHWLEVNCEKGHIHWDNDPGRAHVYRVDRDEWENLELPVDFERNDLFLAEMRHFLEVVAGKASPRVSLDDGVKALKLTEAVHRSAETGRRVQF